MLDTSANALDFGDVPAGTTSEPRQFTIMRHAGNSEHPAQFGGFSAFDNEGNEGVFEIESAPSSFVELDDCEQLAVTLTLTAPATPGVVEGTLAWQSEIETDNGTFLGTIMTPLVGRSVAR